MPGLDRPAALITLDNGFDHTKPNTFGPGGLASLDAAITEALAGRPGVHRGHRQAVHLLRRRRPHRHAAASAPASRRWRSAGSATGSSPGLRDSTVPTFAFVNGAAMGGGLELALHCHYRTLSAGVAALALPEVSLGLVPGWGGTQLLPNLIGIINAAQVIVQNPLKQNKMLRADAGPRAGHRGRAVRAGRLPGALAGVGRRRWCAARPP